MRREIPQLFFILAIFFIVGIFLRSFWEIPSLALWLLPTLALAILGSIFILIFLNLLPFGFQSFKIPAISTALLLGVFLGVWHLDSNFQREDSLQKFRDTGEAKVFEGEIYREPDLRSDHIKYTLREKETGALVLVSLNKHPEFRYGDILRIEGNLLTPTEFPDFNYREFLEKDGIYTVMYFPEAELTQKRTGFSLYAGILKVKDVLREGLRNSFPYPQSELLGAMTLGDKQLMPESMKETFNKTGIRHITAISGMHITIIAILLMGFFTSATRLGRNKAFYFVLISLWLYVALVGFPPSAVRAGIMASVVLLAEKIGREYFAPRALILAGAGMLLFNPLLLRFDVGFQLSFLAVLGILYISPFFNLIFDRFIKSPKMEWFNKLLSMTLGAQISTLPILIYNFGLFSGSAPIVNVLIVPLLPFVIGFGFVGILAGVVSQTLGILLSFPAYLLLSYILWISRAFENLAISGVVVENFHYSLIILFYLVLAGVVLFLRKKFYVADAKLLPSFFTESHTEKK